MQFGLMCRISLILLCIVVGLNIVDNCVWGENPTQHVQVMADSTIESGIRQVSIAGNTMPGMNESEAVSKVWADATQWCDKD